MSWLDLQSADPELAAFGRKRLDGRVAYLATLRADGSPRVHPVTPIIGSSRLFVFMEPTSPKGKDLDRDPRFALHASVEDNNGGEGEFMASGRASRVTDSASRAVAASAANYSPADRYILFELLIDRAQSTTYENGHPVRSEWRQHHQPTPPLHASGEAESLP
ncbi:MAG: pyridoxamine 5'-phosphate oxidase family protein, partial [Dehalococcoidia bacterium]